MKKYGRWIWMFACLTFLYCVSEATEVTKVDCVIYFLLMGYIIKDVVLELWHEVICEEE